MYERPCATGLFQDVFRDEKERAERYQRRVRELEGLSLKELRQRLRQVESNVDLAILDSAKCVDAPPPPAAYLEAALIKEVLHKRKSARGDRHVAVQ